MARIRQTHQRQVVSYRDFRTGLTFADVRQMLWIDNPDPATWRYKSRGVVLGYWRQLKLEMWAEYDRRQVGDTSDRVTQTACHLASHMLRNSDG